MVEDLLTFADDEPLLGDFSLKSISKRFLYSLGSNLPFLSTAPTKASAGQSLASLAHIASDTHVLLMMPSAVLDNAYAALGGIISVYSDDKGGALSFMMHEVGHK